MVHYFFVVVLARHLKSIELLDIHRSVYVKLVRGLIRLSVPLQHRSHRFVLLNLLIDLGWFKHCVLPREIKFNGAGGGRGGWGKYFIGGFRDVYERILLLFLVSVLLSLLESLLVSNMLENSLIAIEFRIFLVSQRGYFILKILIVFLFRLLLVL